MLGAQGELCLVAVASQRGTPDPATGVDRNSPRTQVLTLLLIALVTTLFEKRCLGKAGDTGSSPAGRTTQL